MWNVLNLSMSQIWKTVYKYCGLKCFCLLCTTLSSHTDTALISMSTLKACGLFSTAYEPQLQHFFLSFFFFCLFGETMFICNRRNPFRDVRTWGHLQNVAPRVALRLVSHMPFLTSYTVFTVPGAGEKTPLKIMTQKWTNWIFSHVDF